VAGKLLTEVTQGEVPWFAVTVPETGCVAGKLLTETEPETVTLPETGWVAGKLLTETEPLTV
jgi:hypothetical protein